VVEAAKYGAHVATLPPNVLRQLFQHPLTDKGLAAFLADWAKTGQSILEDGVEERRAVAKAG
jgi:transaldolase